MIWRPGQQSGSDPNEVKRALDAFIGAPDWDETRNVLEQRRAVLLTLEAQLAAVQRVEAEQDISRRLMLSLCAQMLLVAQERGIEAGASWVQSRVNEIKRAAEEARRQIEQMTPEQRRALEERLRAETRQNISGMPTILEGDDVLESVSADGGDDPSKVLEAFLTAKDWDETFRVLERHQEVLLTGDAAQALRELAQRLHKDNQDKTAREIEVHVWILETATRDGITAMQRAFPAARERIREHGIGQMPQGQQHGQAGDAPELDERSAARLLIEQGALDETTTRALRAWLREPGAQATGDEIERALADLRVAMQYLA